MDEPADGPWMTVAAFDATGHAERLCSRLQTDGFAARIHDERALQRCWFLSRPHACLQVQVPKREFEATKVYLDHEAHTGLLSSAVHCPSCHSPRVQFPQINRNFVLPTLVAHLGVLLGLTSRQYYCEHCHHTWPERRTGTRSAQRADVHAS